MATKRSVLFIAAAFLLWSPLRMNAQEVLIENVSFEQVDQDVVIHYSLIGKPGKKYAVSLALSDNNGATFRLKPEAIKGDVGKNVEPGKFKQITWFLRQDFPQGLDGNGFVFAVYAKQQKGRSKWPYIVGGGGIVGGAVYYFSKQSKSSEPPSKGAVTVRVPGEL
jgi:hypothetical protein